MESSKRYLHSMIKSALTSGYKEEELQSAFRSRDSRTSYSVTIHIYKSY